VTAAARTLLAALFLVGAVYKGADNAVWAAEMQRIGLPGATIWGVVAFEAAAGLAVAIGGRPAVLAAPALALYVLPINLLFYPFWASEGEVARLQASAFAKNLALAGGLLYVAAREWEAARRPPR
jgi:putative oxidoreductase